MPSREDIPSAHFRLGLKGKESLIAVGCSRERFSELSAAFDSPVAPAPSITGSKQVGFLGEQFARYGLANHRGGTFSLLLGVVGNLGSPG